MARRCPPLLCYITDRSQFSGPETTRRSVLIQKIAEAARAGVDYIQLREKDLTGRELESLAKSAVQSIREQQTPNGQPSATRLLINSRADGALAADADGVHLRSNDIMSPDVRSIWDAASMKPSAPGPLVAVSCHTMADVVRAESDGADFAVFGPVFEKAGSSAVDLAGLREACRAGIPVLALGGITLENSVACLNAGAAGIAGIRIFQENRIAEIISRVTGDRSDR